MARIPDGFRLATDSSGDPVPGAYLYIYRRGTTTPVTTYSDSALTTANAHPVVADASGAFGPAYLAAGSFKVKMTTALGVDLPGTPIDNVECADEIISVADLTAAAAAALYPAVEVRVRSLGKFLTYAASEPAVASKFQDANGYWFGEAAAVIPLIPTPEDFGALGDGTTDDSTAINAWAAYCRANNRKGYAPAKIYYCGNSTLYLGGMEMDGAGSALNNRWPTVQTIFLSNANPIISMAVNATTAVTFQGQRWGRFGVAYAGGTVAPIDLWGIESYTGQIGIWLGRSHNFMQKTTDTSPETSIAGGVGSINLHDFTVQDVTGWGVYAYKLWGDSKITHGLIRCCGGTAAKAYVTASGALIGNAMGGGMKFDSLCVDTVVTGVHAFGTGNGLGVLLDATLDDYGTAFAVGEPKTLTDALSRVYDSSNNLHFLNCHSEGYNEAIDFKNSKWGTLQDFNSNGGPGTLGGVTIGYASNPPNDCRWQVVRLRVGSAKYVRHCQDTLTSFTEMVNSTPSTVTPFQYWRGITFDILGCGHGQNTPAEAGWTVSPQYDPTDMPGGSAITDNAIYLPFGVSSALPTDPFDNLVPTFNDGAGGTTITGWTSTGAGTTTVGASGTVVTVVGDPVGAGGDVIEYAGITVTAGEIMTARIYVRSALDFGGDNVVIYLRDNADTLFLTRTLGSGTQDAGLYLVEFNFTAPSGGEVKFQFVNANDSPISVDFVAPRIVRGLTPASPATIPALWAASNGVYTTA
jgi:hypothetical protein